MKVTPTRPLLLLLAAIVFLLSNFSVAQNNGLYYSYLPLGSSWSANAGTILTPAATVVDEAVYPITPTALTWPAGFYYGSKYYPSTTTIYVSTNG
ncbi:MAG: hypothetical protein ABI763_09185 [Bacteroidota bacterium]